MSTRFTPSRSAGTPSARRPPRPGEALDAVDRDRRHRREAAGHGVAHRVEDRAGVRGAAGEEGEREDDERRRAQRLSRRHELPVAAAPRRSARRRGGRPAHEQRRGHERRPDDEAMTTSAARQSIWVMSQAANGDIVIGATPTPTETSETARPRCSVIQPITAAIIGEKKLPTATPTSRPKASWNCSALVARLARNRPRPRSTAPASTTGAGRCGR